MVLEELNYSQYNTNLLPVHADAQYLAPEYHLTLKINYAILAKHQLRIGHWAQAYSRDK